MRPKARPASSSIHYAKLSAGDIVISKCYRCGRPLLKWDDERAFRCTNGHQWEDWIVFAIGYKRWSRTFIVFTLYSVLAAIACGMYALMHTNLSYAMWALAWVLIANLCALQLPSKE